MMDKTSIQPDQPIETEKAERLPPHQHVAISGYYGFGNLGDDLILWVLIEELKKRGIRTTVLSNNPRQTQEHFKVEAIGRLDILSILNVFNEADLLISGGGGLFQDVKGIGSILYYGSLIQLARFYQVHRVFLGQSLGPLKRVFSRRFTRSVLNLCQAVTVRDVYSAELVRYLTGNKPVLCADPVWLLNVPDESVNRSEYSTWNIGVSLRRWKALTPIQLDNLADFFKRLTENSEKPVQFYLMPFHPTYDNAVLDAFEARLRARGFKAIFRVLQEEIVSTMTQCHFMFGMRLHSIILAVLANVPVFGLIYDQKVDSLLKELGLQGIEVGLLDHLDEDTIRKYFALYPEIDLEKLRQEASKNFDCLDQLLIQDPGEYIPVSIA